MIRWLIFAVFVTLAAAVSALNAQAPGYPPTNSFYVGNDYTQPPSWKTLAATQTILQLGTMAFQNATGVAITGGTITGMPNPLNNQDVATKFYVDHTVTGLFPHTSARLVTQGALPANVYNNGSAGVGATLTATSNGSLSLDSTPTSAGNRVLIKDEANQVNNGIYVVTSTGDAGTRYILTRATDANSVGIGPNALSAGTYLFVTAGVVMANTGWAQSSPLTAIGTSPIIFSLFAANAVSSVNGFGGPVNIIGGGDVTVTTAAPNITVAVTGVPIGTEISCVGFNAPSNFVFESGQTLSRTTFATLLSQLTLAQSAVTSNGNAAVTGLASTEQLRVGMPVEATAGIQANTVISGITSATAITLSRTASATGARTLTFFAYGNGDGATTFNVPDRRGVLLYGRDNMGNSVKGTLTAANTTNSPDSLGAAMVSPAVVTSGGSVTLAQTYLPATNVAVTIGAGQGSHTHSVSLNSIQNIWGSAGAGNSAQSGAGFVFQTGNVTINNAGLPAMGGSTSNLGSGTPLSVVNPGTTTNWCLRVL